LDTVGLTLIILGSELREENMMFQDVKGSGARFLLNGACLVIVVAGLREASSLFLPFAIALFLSILSMPVLTKIRSKALVPDFLAVLITLSLIGAIFSGLILLGVRAVSDLQIYLPGYRDSISNLYTVWIEGLSIRFGFPIQEYLTVDFFDPGVAVDFFGRTAASIVGFLTNTFLVLLIMGFILAEATIFPPKFKAISMIRKGMSGSGEIGNESPERSRLTKIAGEVQEYLAIKTLISLATGLLIGLATWRLDLDFPVLLGLIGFVMNYIPTVGSILAAIPAILLSLVQFGTLTNFGLVVLSYFAINVVFGNLVEPNLLGRRLGLSTLVVVLSLLVWAWIWGPVGALLAVPLTMVVKIMLENTEDLRWVAILLDKSPEAGIQQTKEPKS